MSALKNILGAYGKIVGTAASTAAHAIPGVAQSGLDYTPGYSARAVAKTQLGKLNNSFADAPNKAPTATAPTSLSGPYNGGLAAGGGYGTDAAQVQQDALSAQLRQQIMDRIGQITGVYDALNRAVDSTVQDKSGQIRQNYGNQTTQLNNQFSDTANGIAGNYGNRGIGDSSYAGNAQDSARSTYNTNLQGINQSQNNDLANLGQYAQQAHAQYNTGRQGTAATMNGLNNYGTADLQTLYGNLGSTLQGAQTDLGGQGTQKSFINNVNAISPVQNGGASALQSQLQGVLNSAAPGFAKQAIGQGLITQASNGDPAAQDYYSKLFQQLQTTSTTGK